MNNIVQFIFNLLIAADQLINTVLLGHPDETLSSRLGRTVRNERYVWVKYLRLTVDHLFFFDYTHDAEGNIIRHCHKSVMPLEQQNFREMIDYEIWSWSNK